MKLCNFYSKDDPICLFCKTSVVLLNDRMGTNNLEYCCKNCHETYIVAGSVKQFYFSVLDVEVYVNFITQTMRLANKYSDSTILPEPVPLIEFDFINRYKLAKKLKTYLTFS